MPEMALGSGWQLIVGSNSEKTSKSKRRKTSEEKKPAISLKTQTRTIYGTSGVEYEVDFLLTTSKPSNCQRVAVLVRDYKGPAKVTNVHQAAHLQNDCREIDKVLLVSNRISGPAKNLAKRSGIQTLSRDEIVAIMNGK
ncbi:MAG: restriction endonuclease [Candidatus Hodarchaeales archaeon]|jgi:hypothetical protein